MNDPLDTTATPPSRLSGWGVVWTLLAWVVILAAVGLVILNRFVPLRPQTASEHADAGEGTAAVVLRLQLSYLVGAGTTLGDAASLADEVRALNRGPVLQRLRVITALGELAGPHEALDGLDQILKEARQENVTLSPSERQAATLLERLYRDFEHKRLAAPSLRPADREALRDDLGEWFAALALHPADGPDEAGRAAVLSAAQRTFLAMFGVLAAALVLGGLGCVGLVVALVLLSLGMIRPRFTITGATAQAGIYAETFALWLVLYPGLTGLAHWLLPQLEMLPRAMLAMPLSLSVLLWPVLRGVPWREVRSALGWSGGVNPFAEVGAGLLCYVVNLPIVFVGFGMTYALIRLQGGLGTSAGGAPDFAPDSGVPSHPIVRYLATGSLREGLPLFVLAAVIAPLVEETMFRGLLYRHLRELTAGAGRLLSFLGSSFVVCLLFAAIHPQGLAAIPVLMALAFGFCLSREWRGSLIPAICAHALNNATVVALGMFALAP